MAINAASSMAKNAADHIPYCKDQGMHNLMGAAVSGQSMFMIRTVMPSDGIIVLPYVMENTTYAVSIHNHTDQTKSGLAAYVSRTVSQFTITVSGGPSTNDVLDVIIVGQIKGQLGAAAI